MLLRHGANPAQGNCSGKIPVDCAANEHIVKLLRNDMIASSSSDSGTSDIRSPTSPESNGGASDKEDYKEDPLASLKKYTEPAGG